jgi:hypothetical protein
MVPLLVKTIFDPRFPGFPVRRLVANLLLEPTGPAVPSGSTIAEGAVIDSAAGYMIIPYKVHRSQYLKIYQELEAKPYRILSMHGEPTMQRFAEVGLRFLVKDSTGQFGYWPAEFVRVKAYLLDEAARPKDKVLVGLDALLENFITHLEKSNSYLKNLTSQQGSV